MGGKQRVRKGYTAVTKVVGHVTRLLNVELNSFYESNMDAFDPEKNSVNPDEFTHEQFAVYQEFEKLLNRSLQKFVEKEGYIDIDHVFNIIQKACVIDKKNHKRFLDNLTRRIKQLQLNENNSESNYQSNDADKTEMEEKTASARKRKASDSSEESEKVNLFPTMVYAPSTLESLINSLMKITEYQTFSRIMQSKVCQQKTIEKLKQKEAKSVSFRKKLKKRLKKAMATSDVDELTLIYTDVKIRLIDLLPKSLSGSNHHPFKDIFENEIKQQTFEEALVEEDALKLLKSITSILHHVSSIGNQALWKEVSEQFERIKQLFPEEVVESIRAEAASEEHKNVENYVESDIDFVAIGGDALGVAHHYIDVIEDSLFEKARKMEEMRENLRAKTKELFKTSNEDECEEKW